MEERYSRNRLYVSEKEQSIIKDYKIFLGGAGIGSIVAECALRFGFELLLSGKNKLKALYLFIHRYCSRFTHPGAWFSVSNCKHYKIHLF